MLATGHYDHWQDFAKLHYLTNKPSKACRVYLWTLRGKPVAIVMVMRFPHGHIKNGWRVSRFATLPEYQGRGYGYRLLMAVAKLYHKNGGKLYLRTENNRLACKLRRAKHWKESKNSGKTTCHRNNRWKTRKTIGWSFRYCPV